MLYTPAGLIQTITDAQNNVTSYTYDARGNRAGVIDPINGSAHPTVFAYDVMNRLTGITYPDNTSVGFGYDYRGRRTSATDQNSRGAPDKLGLSGGRKTPSGERYRSVL